MSAADRFREIDTQVAEARRALGNGGDRKTAIAHLGAIQILAQNGLRDAIANEPKLEALFESRNDLRVALKLCIPWLGRLIADGGHKRCAGPGAAIAVLKQAEAEIAKVSEPSTGEPT